MKLKIHQGDITKIEADAIVNAANRTLLGGGGVDGAIHRAAGKNLLKECKSLNGCDTGDAKYTKGYNLPADYVIHAVGPVWKKGRNNEAEKLASAYRRSLEIADELGCKTIAFPNISTGIFGFPKDKAAEIAIKAVRDFEKNAQNIEEVIFAIFDNENFEQYRKRLE